MKKSNAKKSPPSRSQRKPAAVARTVNKKDSSILEARPGKSREVKKDGWMNILTGIGQKSKDKRLSSCITWTRLEEQDAEHAYAGDKMARKIVDLPVEEALKKGWTIKLKNPEDVKKVTDRAKKLCIHTDFESACKVARLHGGAGIIVNNGEAKLEAPLTKVGKIVNFTVLNKWELYAQQEDVQRNILAPDYGLPKRYTLQPRGSTENLQKKIHTSRVIRFDGAWLPDYLYRNNMHWGDSELNGGLLDAIRDYQLSNDSMALMIQDYCIAVFKLKGLADQVGADGDENVIKRLQIINLAKSVARAVVIDADNEEFTHQSRQIAGLSELHEKVEGRLVSQTHFPHTVLFGNSPSGMGGTGGHEQSNWYDYLQAWQTNYAKPRLLEIYGHICDELGIDKNDLDIEFPPLKNVDELALANTRKVVADTDNIYLQNGVLNPEDVAKNRFGGEKYSMDTKIEMLPEGGEPGSEGINLNPPKKTGIQL
jgi:phage-related protein (TIGR01555 family)